MCLEMKRHQCILYTVTLSWFSVCTNTMLMTNVSTLAYYLGLHSGKYNETLRALFANHAHTCKIQYNWTAIVNSIFVIWYLRLCLIYQSLPLLSHVGRPLPSTYVYGNV